MARPYRLQAAETLYHVIVRGNERKAVFKNDNDYRKYLIYLEKSREKYQCHIYAYVLMGNHVHLLLETLQPNISQIMHYISSSYTTYFNKKYRRNGHLFQGRYKSIVVDKDSYLLELTRYIHLNPVRANMVRKAEEYEWSSYRAYIGKKKDAVVSLEELKYYHLFSSREYRNFVEGVSANEVKLKTDMYAGFILGQKKFIKGVLKELKHQVGSKDVSFAARVNDRYALDGIIKGVCQVYEIDEGEMKRKKRNRSEARNVAIYILKELTSCGNSEIGERFGISYSAVSKAVGVIEREMEECKRLRKVVVKLISQFKG